VGRLKEWGYFTPYVKFMFLNLSVESVIVFHNTVNKRLNFEQKLVNKLLVVLD
jgi:hypothetical protein